MSESESALRERVQYIFTNAKYFALAVDYNGEPWAATINYVCASRDPIQLLFYSARKARHSIATYNRDQVAGCLYVTNAPARGLDGCQFRGSCIAVDDSQVTMRHHQYYWTNFPNDIEREEWLIPAASFSNAGQHSFFVLTINELWLVDDETWDEDKIDRRQQVSATF